MAAIQLNEAKKAATKPDKMNGSKNKLRRNKNLFINPAGKEP